MLKVLNKKFKKVQWNYSSLIIIIIIVYEYIRIQYGCKIIVCGWFYWVNIV